MTDEVVAAKQRGRFYKEVFVDWNMALVTNSD
jgi:hypothetical protein